MKCFVTGCPTPSVYEHGGFCTYHWNQLPPLLQAKLVRHMERLKELRSECRRALENA